MPAGDAYRIKAAELTAQARDLPKLRTELESLALSYLRLADQADQNALTDVVHEPPPAHPVPDRPVAQQQQQPQPGTEPVTENEGDPTTC